MHFLIFCSKTIFDQKLFSLCWDKFDYRGSLYTFLVVFWKTSRSQCLLLSKRSCDCSLGLLESCKMWLKFTKRILFLRLKPIYVAFAVFSRKSLVTGAVSIPRCISLTFVVFLGNDYHWHIQFINGFSTLSS